MCRSAREDAGEPGSASRPARDRVERGEGLVQQQHRPAGHQRAQEGDPLAHPARELARPRRTRTRASPRRSNTGRRRARGPRRGRGPRGAGRGPRCRAPRARAAAGRAGACSAQRREALGGGRGAADRDRPAARARAARRRARAGSTCRTRRGRRCRAPRRPPRRGRCPRAPAARRRSARRRAARRRRLRRSLASEVGVRARGDRVSQHAPSARITAQVRRVSGGWGCQGAISARLPASPPGGRDQCSPAVVGAWRSSASSWCPSRRTCAGRRPIAIEQGYLSLGADGEVRLRRRGERLLLTVKRGEGLSRDEAEIELDPRAVRRALAADRGAAPAQAPPRHPAQGPRDRARRLRGRPGGARRSPRSSSPTRSPRARSPRPAGSATRSPAIPRYLNESLAVNGRPG